jgi:uncharacterized protein involved in propanediol utilization
LINLKEGAPLIKKDELKRVYLVITGGHIAKSVEAVFSDSSLAKTFAKEFPTGRVQDFVVYSEPPKVYKHEVWMEKDTGDIIETNETLPSLDVIVIETSDGLIYALGSSHEESEKLAEEFRQSLLENPI